MATCREAGGYFCLDGDFGRGGLLRCVHLQGVRGHPDPDARRYAHRDHEGHRVSIGEQCPFSLLLPCRWFIGGKSEKHTGISYRIAKQKLLCFLHI